MFSSGGTVSGWDIPLALSGSRATSSQFWASLALAFPWELTTRVSPWVSVNHWNLRRMMSSATEPERSPEALSEHLPIAFPDLPGRPYDERARGACEARAASYFNAFEKNKSARRERLRDICGGLDSGPIIVSTFNWGYRRLVENWAASCHRHGINCRAHTLLFPMDAGADAFARDLGFRTFFDGVSYGELPTQPHEAFGDLNFRKCLFAKLATTQDMLEIGLDVLRQDVDLVWLRDPRAYLARRMDREGLDFLFMHDGPNPLYEPLHYNSGFVWIRNNAYSRHAWSQIFSNYARIFHYGSEQVAINVVLTFLRERGLRTARLPDDVFVNGHVLSRAMEKDQTLPAGCAVVHASWTKNIELKLAHLEKFGLWYV